MFKIGWHVRALVLVLFCVQETRGIRVSTDKMSTKSHLRSVRQEDSTLEPHDASLRFVQMKDVCSTQTRLSTKHKSNTGAVRELQNMLQALGCDIGSAGADGDFGRGTESGVKAFQTANGLTVDGDVGPNTYSKLCASSGVKRCDGTDATPSSSPSANNGGGGGGSDVTPSGGGSPSSSTSPSLPTSSTASCGAYGSQTSFDMKGNHDVVYKVYKIAREHWASSESSLAMDPSEKDNSIEVSAACAFDALHSAAKAQGQDIKITSGFRTLARQQYFWNCYQTKSCNNGNLAARPGTSNHGRGKALDLASMGGKASSADYDFCKQSPKYVWMAANAGKFGFIRTVEKECWHWEYRPGEAAPSYQCAGTCPDTASAHDIAASNGHSTASAHDTAASNGHSAHDTAASNGHSEPTQEAGADTACSAAKIIHESRALEKEIKDRHGDAYGTSFDGYGTSGADKWVCSTWVAEILKRAGCPGGQGLSNDVNIVSFPPPLANAIQDDHNSIKGSVNALVSRGLGTEVPFDKLDTLVAGDLCQWWSSLSSGHSVIVAGPKFDGKWTITGSHKSKKGVFDMSVDLASYTGTSKRIYCVHPTASSPSTGIQEEIECKVPDNEGGFREGICATSSDCVGPLFELQPDRSSCKTSGEQCCVTSDDNRAHPGAEGGPEELDDMEEEKDDEIGDSTESAESDDVPMAPDTATCPENRRSTNVCMEVYGHSTCGEKQVTGSCGECARTIKAGYSGVNWVCEPDENGGEKRGYIQDDPNHSSRQSPEPITRNEILKRGLTWINNRIRYSQRRYHYDPDVGQRYRTDCTGYVSMAWNIDQIGSTSWVRGIKDAGPDENKLFKSIACSELLPGDALVNNGHIVLFRKWSNKEAGQFYVWHESGSTSGTVQGTKTFEGWSVSSPATAFAVKYSSSQYNCIRRLQITE